jgi:hypothetical protein
MNIQDLLTRFAEGLLAAAIVSGMVLIFQFNPYAV